MRDADADDGLCPLCGERCEITSRNIAGFPTGGRCASLGRRWHIVLDHPISLRQWLRAERGIGRTVLVLVAPDHAQIHALRESLGEIPGSMTGTLLQGVFRAADGTVILLRDVRSPEPLSGVDAVWPEATA
jgi:hypothetical protein